MSTQTQIVLFVLFPIVGYLLGSVPVGVLIGLSRGVNIRKQGSGNIGATNVSRILGRKWGKICFFLDISKGLIPVLLVLFYLRAIGQVESGKMSLIAQGAILLTGAACILGHIFSIFLRFRGGKGVSTWLGVLLGIWPYFTLTAAFVLAVWVAVWGMTRYVSLASINAAIAFPLGFLVLVYQIKSWELRQLWLLFAFSCLMAALIIFRHRSNIARLLAGTESRGKKNNH
jgi:acyl phosphate:glycerol-3-phosphate acyltransferase